MAEWTTEDVRERVADACWTDDGKDISREKFDAWLAAHDAEVRAQTEAEVWFPNWFPLHDAEVRAQALRDAADAYGPAQITYMGSADGYVKAWLRARADREADHG